MKSYPNKFWPRHYRQQRVFAWSHQLPERERKKEKERQTDREREREREREKERETQREREWNLYIHDSYWHWLLWVLIISCRSHKLPRHCHGTWLLYIVIMYIYIERKREIIISTISLYLYTLTIMSTYIYLTVDCTASLWDVNTWLYVRGAW